jgi:hypothetical protein
MASAAAQTPPALQTQPNEPTVALTRTEMEVIVSALQWATSKGAWVVEDLEMMGRLQTRLRHLLQTMPPRPGAAATAKPPTSTPRPTKPVAARLKARVAASAAASAAAAAMPTVPEEAPAE